ncbi:MAG: glycosyltransferase family 2 protein [Lachnospiraceae bacterium]|nr:glycosyltransferase family 2 protein [Lachnospiraceae bacterium]
MNKVNLALNICTYKREHNLKNNLEVLKNSEFFNPDNPHYYNKLHIFVIDNASELVLEDFPNLHFFHNSNTGGSGGFQRGIEEIRKISGFTHVIFMDDDVKFEMSSFYILFDFLEKVDDSNADRPVAGRMLDLDNPNIQWTAAEKWNTGDIQHVEFLRDIMDPDNPYTPGKVIYDADADYGGFWFCCYPYSFVKDNDILPFFLHCDDVEYGLRCGKPPIIIEGVHVWHETWDKKINPLILYFDCRNSLFINDIYAFVSGYGIKHWLMIAKEYHEKREYKYEKAIIFALFDYYKGINFLKSFELKKIQKRIYKNNNQSIYMKIALAFISLRNMIG